MKIWCNINIIIYRFSLPEADAGKPVCGSTTGEVADGVAYTDTLLEGDNRSAVGLDVNDPWIT